MVAPSTQRHSNFKALKRAARDLMRLRNHKPGKPSREQTPSGFLIYASEIKCSRCGKSVWVDAEEGTMKGDALLYECGERRLNGESP